MTDDQTALELAALRAEVSDWRAASHKAALEPCGDELHCSCVGVLRARVAELGDKAIRFDLDAIGIASRERDAVELVDLRARVAALEKACEAGDLAIKWADSVCDSAIRNERAVSGSHSLISNAGFARDVKTKIAQYRAAREASR